MPESKPVWAVAAAAGLLAVAAVDVCAQDHPDLSGSWTLNLAETDDARDFIDRELDASLSARGRRGTRWGGTRPGFGWTDRFGRASGGLDPDRVEQLLELVREPSPNLTISQSDSTVTFAANDGDTLTVQSRGRRTRHKVEGGGDIEIRARWNDDYFVVERKIDRGGKVTESFLRPPDREQLYVIVRVELGPASRRIEFRRVYDLIPNG